MFKYIRIAAMRIKPETNFTDFYDTARFDLTWRITFFLFATLPALFVSRFVFESGSALPSFLGWLSALLILTIMYLTKKYKLAAYSFSVLGVALCIGILLGVKEIFHFVNPLWMVVIILYTYFTLGKVWGNIALILNLSAIVYFIVSMLNPSLARFPQLTKTELNGQAISVLICGFSIAYLVHQFLKTTRHAQDKYVVLTNELQAKKTEVESQSEEKTVMLREIHHRVKNNLQVITSLLRLQSRETDDPKTLELFKDSTNRVIAMALIHEKMYQTKDLAKINLEDYLRTLLTDLIDSYAIEIPIESDIRSNVEMISNKSLVPLALLFNELVSNSLKHGFNNKTEGKIKIDIFRDKGKIVLSYWDDGIWREKQKETSFGLELIESLTEQMDGVYKRSTNLGTSYEFILPDNL